MIGRFLRCQDGAVAVEAGLIVGLVLTPLMFGFCDLAQIGIAKAQVDGALQDTVSYVAAGNAANGAGIVSAAQSAYGDKVKVATTTTCYCISTTTSPVASAAVACTGSCSSGYDLQQMMRISVSLDVSLLFAVPYLGASYTVVSAGVVRTG